MLNKFTEYTAPKIILVSINIVRKNPMTVCKEDLKASNSPQKLSDPGIEIFASVNIKNNEDRIGIEINKPLYTLITLEWNLSYTTVAAINKPELTNPWAIISIIDANKPSIELENSPNVTKPMCETEE